MPIHDWTRTRAGNFHHFHQRWIQAIGDALNTGGLPPGYFALSERKTGGPEPDVVTLRLPNPDPPGPSGGTLLAEAPLRTRFRTESDAAHYARRADRLTIRNDDGTPVAVIEIVSPGNKDSRSAMTAFARKMANYLFHDIHVLVIDLFPPNPRNPQGVHKAIWDRIKEEDFALPADKPLTLAAYSAGAPTRAFIEPVAVGDPLPDMPIFLMPDRYVPCPLDATYAQSWAVFPAALRGPLVADQGSAVPGG